MKVKAKSDTGLKRQNNEDSFYISDKPVGMFEALYMVADGMGGYQGGEVASSVCINAILSYIKSAELTTPFEMFRGAVEFANNEVRQKANSLEQPGMGTTIVIAGLISDTWYLANVGDSRAYIIDREDFSIQQITKDHSYVEEQVAKGLLDRDSEEYQRNKHIITRAIGADEDVVPDFYDAVAKEDSFLLLCSDGLSNMITDLKIKNLILDDSFSLEKRVDTLIDVANQNGGKDNITIVLVEV